MINPVIFRLGIKTDWFLKFMENKKFELKQYLFNYLSLFNFTILFFYSYKLKINSIHFYYNKIHIIFYINYFISNYYYKKHKILVIKYYNKLKLKKILFYYNFIFNTIKYFLKLYLLKFYNNIYQYNCFILSFISLNFINKRLNLIKFINFIKFKYKNLKLNYYINNFIIKFIISYNNIIRNKTGFCLIFKQLDKNFTTNLFFYFKKFELIYNILKFRKFNILGSNFKFMFNLIYNLLILKNKTLIISELINLNYSLLKQAKYIILLLNFIASLLYGFLLKSNIINKIFILLKGCFKKYKNTVKLVLVPSSPINNVKINNNINFNQTTIFLNKSTIGLKTYIKD